MQICRQKKTERNKMVKQRQNERKIECQKDRMKEKRKKDSKNEIMFV